MLNRLASSLLSFRPIRAVSAYFQPTPNRTRSQRIVSLILFACLSYVIMGPQGCGTCGEDDVINLPPTVRIAVFTAFGIGYALPFGNTRPGVTAKITGTDGSQTGTASFLGNFTSITQPTGTYFLMNRAPDCSLNLLTGSSSLTGNVTINGVTPNYERTLHQLASLTTTADVYAGGCPGAPGGLSTRPAVVLPKKANSAYVFAVAAGNANNNAVFIVTPSSDLSSSTFKAITSLPSASALTAAEFNGDGNGDLLVVNAYNPSSAFVSVVLGNGDGTFQNPVSYPTAGSMSVAAVVDDINGDGKMDIIAVSDDQTISVLTGNGDGTFNAAQNFSAPLPGSSTPTSTPIVNLITADVNGDGKKDIVCSNGLVLLGNGSGGFNAVSSPAFPYTTATSSLGPNLAAGDVNKDGKMDIVLNDGNLVSVWLGNGDGTFTRGASYASIANTGFVTITDLDGDGNLDIYSGLSNSGLFSGDDSDPAAAYVLMGNGDGTFVGAPSAPAAYNGSNLADVNNDGYPDLIVPTSGTSNGQTAVFTVQLGSAKGAFTPTSTITAPVSVTFSVSEFTSPITENTSNLGPSSYVISDVNGDGKPDVVYVANYRQYAVYFVALGNGDGTFTTATATGFPQLAPSSGFDINTIIGSLRIGDFNHDGKADLLFNFNDIAEPFGNGLYLQGLGVLPGNGDGTFGAPILSYTYNSQTTPGNGGIPSVSQIADLNLDGYPDVIATNSSFAVVNGVGVTTGLVQAYLGKADGTFAAPTAAITTTYLGQLTVADFNKDGKLDIAALVETSTSEAQLAITLGNGDGTFATPTLSSLAGGDAIRSSGLASADFDADGNVDLALLDNNDFGGIFYGKGDGTFASVPFNGSIIPKDLITVGASGQSVATDLNKDGKPDILVGQTVLLNLYGSAPKTAFSTTVALTTSASTITSGGSVTLTATVTGASGSTGTPTGSVTFLDGTTTLGTGTLSSGVATLSITSLITAGNHSLTAVYGGDTNFTGNTSAAVTVTITAPPPPDFALSISPGSGDAARSSSTTATLTVTPSNGFNSAVSFACSGQAAGVTCGFNPATVTPSGAAATTVVSFAVSASAARQSIPQSRYPKAPVMALVIGAGALIFGRRRLRLLGPAGLWVLIAGIMLSVNGCGGSSSKPTTSKTPATATTTITITGTSGTLSHTSTFTLTYQ